MTSNEKPNLQRFTLEENTVEGKKINIGIW